ncbi:MAG: HEAT repeat domain-containing protein [Planctomycetes bacterium]|nr:HEAT repeat domain-containing protein [Planctomycetota bacterium]
MRYARSIANTAVILAAPVVWFWTNEAARGEVLKLANGGQIEGRLVEDANKDHYIIETSDGRISIAQSQVVNVESTSEDEQQYEALARTSPDTVEAHWKLAGWCRERKLRDEAQQHLTRILQLDPHHAEARALLGFKNKDGTWMTRDEVLAARGLVLYEGRHVAVQHVELFEREKEIKLSQADWADKLDRWRRALVGRREDRAAQALSDIRQVDDPQAAEPLVRLLEREADPELTRLWIETAARIDHPACIEALVRLSLFDDDEEVREQCLDILADSGRRGIVTPYIRELRSKENEIVNRAGTALGRLGTADAIGPLIDALSTKHTIQVGNGNPDQQGYTFSPDGGAFSFGGGPQIVTREIRNPAVLNALVQLAGGTSFDYDQDAWRAWLAAQARLHVVDVRRDE